MQRRGKMVKWLLLIIYVLTSAFGMVFMKKGGADTGLSMGNGKIQIQASWMILCGIAFYLFSFILWMFILQLFNLTYISPVAYGMTYVFIIVFSHMFLREGIQKEQLIGVFFIIAGTFIASYRRG